MTRSAAAVGPLGAVGAALVLLGAACAERPVGPGDGDGELQINAAVNNPTVSTLVIEVTAPDLTDRYVFNLEFVDGVAVGTIVVPAGGRRTIAVRAYDVEDIQTHAGQATANIRPGLNPVVRITLRPLTGQQPIEVVLGSFTVAVEPAAASMAAGQTRQMAATVTDVDGTVVGGTADVVWATDAPAVATVDAAGLVAAHHEGRAAIVASFGGVTAAATITVGVGPGPSPQRIAFTSFRDGNAEIYVMNGDGSGQTNLTKHPAQDGVVSVAWSPDGSKLAFDSERDGNVDIFVINADGSGEVNLTSHAAADFAPAWSPDGAKIAFMSDRDNVAGEIYVMNANGTGVTRLTNNPSVFDAFPVWSPDGSKIVFLRTTNFADVEICVMNADGTGVINLTNTPAFNFMPVWSPDGTKIAFMSDRDGAPQIYVQSVDGTSLARLTNTAPGNFAPVWSPDGSKIAFLSGRDGNSEIYVMNADGSAQTNLTRSPGQDGGFDAAFSSLVISVPAWSADGSRIAFDSDRDGNVEIYVMNADGTGQTNLTNDAAGDVFPRWGPIR